MRSAVAVVVAAIPPAILLMTLAAAAPSAQGREADASTGAAAIDTTPSRESPAPFFFSGNGHLTLHHTHLKERLDVRYRHADGSYDDKALRQIRRFFRSRGDGREGDMALRLIELLAFVQVRFQPRRMILMSGYRSPQHNDGIRAAGAQAAKASLHTEGLAADVKLVGVDLRDVWLQLRDLATGGAGYYRSDAFLHLDSGLPRFWEETTSRVSEDLSGGNARVFARTDFDRYDNLHGAEIKLHSVTAFPLRVGVVAEVVDGERTHVIKLAPGRGTIAAGDCIEVPSYAAAYVLRVAESPSLLRGRVVLATCAPRQGRTPERIESNPIEVGSGRAG